MKEKTKIRDFIQAEAERMRGTAEKLNIRTNWLWECFDKNGNLKWSDFTPNVCTTEGINFMLDVMFHGTAAVATWYIALFEADYTPLITNTYAVPGYTESTAYDEATRPAYNEAAASSKVTTNAANKAVFTFNDTKTIYGGSLVSDSTKGDTAASGAVLFCSSKLTSSQPVISTDVLRVTIAITGADT